LEVHQQYASSPSFLPNSLVGYKLVYSIHHSNVPFTIIKPLLGSKKEENGMGSEDNYNNLIRGGGKSRDLAWPT
jgi:hypothetical protein